MKSEVTEQIDDICVLLATLLCHLVMKTGFHLSLNFALKQLGGTPIYPVFKNSPERMVVWMGMVEGNEVFHC